MDWGCYHSLPRRQEFISTGLRFLCYSIIRTDPNSFSLNQNFVAHSRKILDSRLFEDTLREFVFENNPETADEGDSLYRKVVDPVFLNCVQLYIYVINDLPQKIPELMTSGLIPGILKSLERRMPLQLDMFSIVTKFFRMLTLNKDSSELLLKGPALERFVKLGLDAQSFKHIVMTPVSQRMYAFRSLVHSLANEHQEISDRLYDAIFDNLDQLQQEAWALTADFLDYEAETKEMTEEEKRP